MSTTESRRKSFGMTFPALNGDVVQQGHADYCAEHGHAKHTDVDGNASIYCPRCGDVRETPAAPSKRTTASGTVEHAHADEGIVRRARRAMIDRGVAVSLIAFDGARDLYAFDELAPAVDPEHHAERYSPELFADPSR